MEHIFLAKLDSSSQYIKLGIVVHKLWIERFNYIPNMIELVRKTPKMDDKWKARKQRLVEALTCMCEHLGVIKFLAIHIENMEAYTLWWNGGTLWEVLDYNTKYSPISNNHTLVQQGGPIWKGKHDLPPLGKIMWSWHGHS